MVGVPRGGLRAKTIQKILSKYNYDGDESNSNIIVPKIQFVDFDYFHKKYKIDQQSNGSMIHYKDQVKVIILEHENTLVVLYNNIFSKE